MEQRRCCNIPLALTNKEGSQYLRRVINLPRKKLLGLAFKDRH